MKTRISDLVADCCPAEVDLGKPDEALALRITGKSASKKAAASGLHIWEIHSAIPVV